jgi:WS/DGAT/MGAT family acyltransferase
VRIGRVAWNQAPGAVRSAGSGLRKLAAPRPPAVPRTRFNGPVTTHRVFEARFHDFEDIRRIKAAVPKATVNDVALAYVGGALRHYLTAHGELPDESLVAICPISIRTPDQLNTGGNMLSAMRQPVGSHIADPVKRLATITASTSADRVARTGVGTPALLEVAELLPGALVGLGMRANVLFPQMGAPIANTTVTNVPGSRVPLYFAGAKLVKLTGNGPVLHGGGLIHLISTYAGEFNCAITADRKMMPDPGFYADCMQRSFTELLGAATP